MHLLRTARVLAPALLGALWICSVAAGALEPDSAQAIMAQVAVNQDRAVRLRSAYVYQQQIVMRFRSNDGKLVREESSEYRVVPTPEGTRKELAGFSGKYLFQGRLVDYNASGQQAPGRMMDLDAELIRELREELANDAGARDGLGAQLFPLTALEQEKYLFRLEGEETFRGLPVYRISFRPKSTANDGNICCRRGPWAGEVLVNRQDSQPVLVTTRLASKVPALVRTMLGTNVGGVGFSVRYEKFDDGVWFPVSFGSEFRVRALFFYKRIVTMSLGNSGFRKADVSSRISFDEIP